MLRIRAYNIQIELTDDTWVSNVASDTTLRQSVIDAVLHSTRTTSDFGYETAMAGQVANWPSSQMSRISETKIQIELPMFRGYAIPAFGAEVVAALSIPAAAVASAMEAHYWP